METTGVKCEQELPGAPEDLETLLFSEEYDEAPDDPAAWLSAVMEELPPEAEAETKSPEEEKEALPEDQGLPLTEAEFDPFSDRLGIDYVPTLSQVEREKRTFFAASRREKTPGQKNKQPIGSLDSQAVGLRRPAMEDSALAKKQAPLDLPAGCTPGPMPMGEAPDSMIFSPQEPLAGLQGQSRFGMKLRFSAEDMGSDGMASMLDGLRTAPTEMPMGMSASGVEPSSREADGLMKSDPKPTRPLREDAARINPRETAGPPELRKRGAEAHKDGKKPAQIRQNEADPKPGGMPPRKCREKDAFSAERPPTRRGRAEPFRETPPTRESAAGGKISMDTAPRRESSTGVKSAMDTDSKREPAGAKSALDAAPKREPAGTRKTMDAFCEGRSQSASRRLGELSLERMAVAPDASGRKWQSGLNVSSVEKSSGKPEGLDEFAARARKKEGPLDRERKETLVLSRTGKPAAPRGSGSRELRPGSGIREPRPTRRKAEDAMAMPGRTTTGSRMGLDDDKRTSRGRRMSMGHGSGKKEN